MKRSPGHFVSLLALLGALVACNEDASKGSIEASEFCEEYANIYCDGFEDCCEEAGWVSPSTGCWGQAMRFCNDALLTVDDQNLAPTDPNTPARIVFDFDEAGAAAALSRLKSTFARCKGDPSVYFGDTHYLGEPGSECLRHGDCEEGTRCEHPPLAVFGTCVLAPLEGQECTDICVASDLTCVQDEGDQICVGPRGKGDSCWNAPCEVGLVCVATYSDFGDTDLRCREALREGQSCDANDQCESFACIEGRCDEPGDELDQFCSWASSGLNPLFP